MTRYVAAVQAALTKLVLLLSVLLMPLGMASAGASAPAAGHHSTMTGKAMEHCPDGSSERQQHAGLFTCSMACASALPAQELARDDALGRSQQLIAPMIGRTLNGIQPEIATPPPKFA